MAISNIRKIAQDKYGYIWFASQDGLYRYNSKSCVEYNAHSNAKYKIGGSDVRDIIIDNSNNYAWICTSYGGIDQINLVTGNVEYHLSQKICGNILVKGLFFVKPNLLYIITTKSVYKFNTIDRSVNLLYNLGLDKTDFVNYFLPINGNSFVVYTNNNKILLHNFNDAKQQASVNCGFDTKPNKGFSLTKLKDNEIIATTTLGIFFYKVINNSIMPMKYKSFGAYINKPNSLTTLIDKNNRLWIASTSGVWKEDENYALQEVQPANNLYEDNSFLNTCYQMFCDDDNNIWLGTQNEPYVIKNKPPPFNTIYKSYDKTLSISHAYFLRPVNDSVLYAGAEEGLYKLNIYTKKIQKLSSTISYDYIFTDVDDDIVVSNKSGLFYLRNNMEIPLHNKYRELKSFWPLNINTYAIVNDSITLLASENKKGVIVWNRKEHSIKLLNLISTPSLPDLNINTIAALNKDKYFILSDESICIYDVTKNIVSKNIISNNEYSIFFDIALYKGFYYVASYGKGVLKLDTNFNVINTISISNGLSNNGVYKLIAWHDSLLFITTNNGLNVYNAVNNRIKKYYKSDGLHGNIFEETSGNIFNDKIYVGGIDGITIVSPTALQANAKIPLLYFGDIRIDLLNNAQSDTFNINNKKVSIPSNWLQINITFNGINYSNSERTTYAYRLLEQSGDWINLATQNFITLIGLSPGTYHLQVKAANEDGVWSKPKELILIFLPKWYQTWWFYVLIALTVAGILYALYRYRIAQIKKQHEIRKNIATDLHDDLGSTLNSVKVFTNLAISGVKQEESLQQVKDNLTEATMSLRDMIWVLDDSLDTVDELITRLKQFAIPVSAASNIEAVIKADSEVNSRQLTKEEKRNLFLICKEAINNSIKYSGASHIDVAITASGKKIKIVVADNGKGFNVDEVKKGYGLKNMQYRAGQIKYKVNLTSSSGKGTRLEIRPT